MASPHFLRSTSMAAHSNLAATTTNRYFVATSQRGPPTRSTGCEASTLSSSEASSAAITTTTTPIPQAPSPFPPSHLSWPTKPPVLPPTLRTVPTAFGRTRLLPTRRIVTG